MKRYDNHLQILAPLHCLTIKHYSGHNADISLNNLEVRDEYYRCQWKIIPKPILSLYILMFKYYIMIFSYVRLSQASCVVSPHSRMGHVWRA